jgi:hypothetical protein
MKTSACVPPAGAAAAAGAGAGAVNIKAAPSSMQRASKRVGMIF